MTGAARTGTAGTRLDRSGPRERDLDLRSALRAARLERLGQRASWIYTGVVFGFLFLPIVIVVVFSFNAGRHVTDLIGLFDAVVRVGVVGPFPDGCPAQQPDDRGRRRRCWRR